MPKCAPAKLTAKIAISQREESNLATMIGDLAAAKAAGLSPEALKMALQFIDEAPRA